VYKKELRDRKPHYLYRKRTERRESRCVQGSGMEGKKATLCVRKWNVRKERPLCVRRWNGGKESLVVGKEVEWKERKPRCV
jgi:hypothetical protein